MSADRPPASPDPPPPPPERRPASGPPPRLVEGRAVLALLVHPELWLPAARVVLRSAPAGWWRRWPPVPSPSPAYARFRLHVMHGADERPLDAGELVEFLRWCRRMESLSG